MILNKKTSPWDTGSYPIAFYYENTRFSAKSVSVAADRYKITTPDQIALRIGSNSYTTTSTSTIDLSSDASWDFGQSIGTWQANHAYSVGDWVRSTSIADGSKNISTDYATPVMPAGGKSNTGVFTFSGSYTSGFPSERAFKQSELSDQWISDNTTTDYVGVCFPFGRIINKYSFLGSNTYASDFPASWNIEGSHDYVTWDILDTRAGKTKENSSGIYFSFSNATAYRYYRINVITNNGGTIIRVFDFHLVAQPQLVYKCTSAGTSHSSEPTWGTTVSGTTTDSGATWTAYYDDTVAINRAGTDFYIYACQTATTAPKLLISRNSTIPHGYTANNSRKIGGFHCLCNSVGTISNHTLSDYLTGDILPQSVWDLFWKSDALSNSGLVYDPKLCEWVGIYLTSGSVSAPTIVYNGTILDTITWFQACDAAYLLYTRLPRDYEFQSFAAGLPEATNIYGSADPVTAGGYINTASVRMISHIGCEGCSGQVWQWLDDTSYRFDAAAAHTHNITVAALDTPTATGNASVDVAPAGSYKAETGGKGSLYTQGTYGVVKLLAGGYWNAGADSGSRSRDAHYYPWISSSTIGFRVVARGLTELR